MKETALSKTLWMLCLIYLPALAYGGPDPLEKKVLIIGIDGIRPDALLKAEGEPPVEEVDNLRGPVNAGLPEGSGVGAVGAGERAGMA